MKRIVLICVLCEVLVFNSCTDNVKTGQTTIAEDIEIENGLVAAKDAPLMEVSDYVQWVQNSENGFRKEKVIDDLTFFVQYKPYEYIVSVEERKEEISDTLLKSKIAEINDMQYYDFKISLNEGAGELLKYQLASPQEYAERVNYFAFNMQKDIQLAEGNDTLPCTLYHFERAYDAAPSSTFLLGFPLSENKSQQEKTLLVYDRTFNKGMLKFTFRKKDLKNLPKIKTL